MTREHFNRDNLVVLDFQSIQQPTFRFSFQILDSIQASKLFLLPIFASRFPNLYDDLSNGETLARSRSRMKTTDTPRLSFFDLIHEIDRHDSHELYRRITETSYRCRWIEFDAFRSLSTSTLYSGHYYSFTKCYQLLLPIALWQVFFSILDTCTRCLPKKMKRILCSVRVDRT